MRKKEEEEEEEEEVKEESKSHHVKNSVESSKESKRTQAVKGGFLRRHMKQNSAQQQVQVPKKSSVKIVNLTDIIAALAWAPKSGGDIGNTAEVLCYEVVRKERKGRNLLLYLDNDRKNTVTPAKSYDTTAPSERSSQVLFCRVLSMYVNTHTHSHTLTLTLSLSHTHTGVKRSQSIRVQF